jgi:hypothetical protein
VNYNVVLGTGGSSATAVLTADPQLDGMIIGMNVAPWTVNTPAVSEFLSALKRYAPGVAPGGAAITGWVSAKLFQAAALHAPDPTTSQSILDGLWSIQGDDLGGLTQPLTFTQNQVAPQTLCYWVMQIKGGQYVSPNGGQRACL